MKLADALKISIVQNYLDGVPEQISIATRKISAEREEFFFISTKGRKKGYGRAIFLGTAVEKFTHVDKTEIECNTEIDWEVFSI